MTTATADAYGGPHVEAAQARLDDAVSQYGAGVLAYSGGKESNVLLHLCRQHPEVAAIWVNGGDAFPHVESFIRRATQDRNFLELQGDLAASIRDFGYPADLIPVAGSFWGIAGDPMPVSPIPLQPWTSCCARVRMPPLFRYIEKIGATLFIHGQRSDVEPGFPAEGGPDSIVEICAPLRDWSEEDVMAYVADNDVALPSHYPEVMDSLDCMGCTAIAGDGGQARQARYTYMAREYPEAFERVASVMAVSSMAALATCEEVVADAKMAAASRGTTDVRFEEPMAKDSADARCA